MLAAIASPRSTDLLIEPARLEDAFLELYAVHDAGPATAADDGAAGVISGPLLRHTWRAHRMRVAVIAVALGVWAS